MVHEWKSLHKKTNVQIETVTISWWRNRRWEDRERGQKINYIFSLFLVVGDIIIAHWTTVLSFRLNSFSLENATTLTQPIHFLIHIFLFFRTLSLLALLHTASLCVLTLYYVRSMSVFFVCSICCRFKKIDNNKWNCASVNAHWEHFRCKQMLNGVWKSLTKWKKRK